MRFSHSRMPFVRAYAKANKHPEMRDKTIWEVFEEKHPGLVPYIGPSDGFHAVPASVSKTCLVRFDNNGYSVDARSVGRPVEVRAYADQLECWQDGKIAGQQEQAFGRGKTICDPLHYLAVLAPKPGAPRREPCGRHWFETQGERTFQRMGIANAYLPRSAQIGTSAPSHTCKACVAGATGGDRQMVDILGAILTDGLEAVEAACADVSLPPEVVRLYV